MIDGNYKMFNNNFNKSPIIILHLIDSGEVYGAEVMLLALISEQIKNGIIPILGSIGRKGEIERPLEKKVREMGVSVVRFAATRGIDFCAGVRIVKWAKKNQVSLIHTQGYKPNLIVAFFPIRWRKVPIARTLHGWTNRKEWSKGGLYQRLDILSLRFTESIIAVSKAMLEKPPLLDSPLKVQIIENGIAEPKVDYRIIEQSKTDQIFLFCTNSHMLLSIGRLSEEKGFSNLILGVVKLIREGVDIRLCIIGEGPQREFLEGLVKKHKVQDKILLAGYRENAYRFMALFDTYINSSWTEGLPITILEAMHMGIPIMATKVGGVPEALGQGSAGWIIIENNPESIYEALKKFIKDSTKREEFVVMAKKRAQKIYSSEIMAQKYKKVYLETMVKYKSF